MISSHINKITSSRQSASIFARVINPIMYVPKFRVCISTEIQLAVLLWYPKTPRSHSVLYGILCTNFLALGSSSENICNNHGCISVGIPNSSHRLTKTTCLAPITLYDREIFETDQDRSSWEKIQFHFVFHHGKPQKMQTANQTSRRISRCRSLSLSLSPDHVGSITKRRFGISNINWKQSPKNIREGCISTPCLETETCVHETRISFETAYHHVGYHILPSALNSKVAPLRGTQHLWSFNQSGNSRIHCSSKTTTEFTAPSLEQFSA